MLHPNVQELWLLCDTFTCVWSAGGQANLSLQTKDSHMWAKLDLQLGPSYKHRTWPPVARGRGGAQPFQVRPKGPSAQARDAPHHQELKEKRCRPWSCQPAITRSRVLSQSQSSKVRKISWLKSLTATLTGFHSWMAQLRHFKYNHCRLKAITEKIIKYLMKVKHKTHNCQPGFEEYVFLPKRPTLPSWIWLLLMWKLWWMQIFQNRT